MPKAIYEATRSVKGEYLGPHLLRTDETNLEEIMSGDAIPPKYLSDRNSISFPFRHRTSAISSSATNESNFRRSATSNIFASRIFKYLTWRENYAVLITFSKIQGFTDVVAKARAVIQSHDSYISSTLKEVNETHFITDHRFPEDPKRKVEIHHLLFNLFY